MTRYIDADELEKRTVLVEGDDFDGEYVIPYVSFEMLPTVDTVPVVHAHWNCIENVFSYEGTFGGYECSHCHKMFLDDMCENNGSEMVDAREDFKFCPFCGAKMDEKVEEKTDEKE